MQLNDDNVNIRKVYEYIEKKTSVSNKNADWTNSYRKWSAYEDADENNSESKDKLETERNRKFDDGFHSHSHNHDEERIFYSLPENIKWKRCESHRIMGCYLFQEGMYPKAAEQFQLANSLYEYCFPEHKEDQYRLDQHRQACLCNLSLCHFRRGSYRQSIESASQAIRMNDQLVKAYYRRSEAYLALDEFQLSSSS